jgi:Na+/melibiose symporter-like transporter
LTSLFLSSNTLLATSTLSIVVVVYSTSIPPHNTRVPAITQQLSPKAHLASSFLLATTFLPSNNVRPRRGDQGE